MRCNCPCPACNPPMLSVSLKLRAGRLPVSSPPRLESASASEHSVPTESSHIILNPLNPSRTRRDPSAAASKEDRFDGAAPWSVSTNTHLPPPLFSGPPPLNNHQHYNHTIGQARGNPAHTVAVPALANSVEHPPLFASAPPPVHPGNVVQQALESGTREPCSAPTPLEVYSAAIARSSKASSQENPREFR